VKLEKIEKEISRLLDQVAILRKKRDALKKPPNLKYREMLLTKKQQRKQALKNYLSGMSQVSAVSTVGLNPKNAAFHLSKAYRENFRDHYLAQSLERSKFPYEERPTSLSWLKKHPPTGWESV